MAALSLLYLVILPGLFQALIHLPDTAKIAISVLLIAPLAVCMGMPFPTGMMRLASTSPGCHSVGMGDQWFCLGGRRGPRDLAGYSPGFCRGDSVGCPDLWLGRCRVALRGLLERTIHPCEADLRDSRHRCRRGGRMLMPGLTRTSSGWFRFRFQGE